MEATRAPKKRKQTTANKASRPNKPLARRQRCPCAVAGLVLRQQRQERPSGPRWARVVSALRRSLVLSGGQPIRGPKAL